MVDPINPIHRHHVLKVPLFMVTSDLGPILKDTSIGLRDSPEQPSSHGVPCWKTTNPSMIFMIFPLKTCCLYIYIVDFLINMFGYRRLRSFIDIISHDIPMMVDIYIYIPMIVHYVPAISWSTSSPTCYPNFTASNYYC